MREREAAAALGNAGHRLEYVWVWRVGSLPDGRSPA